MHGGIKVYRGGAAAARHYVEADRSRADDYYLAEGTGLAERFTASPDAGVVHLGSLDGDAYETWVASYDPDTGCPRGRLRTDDNAVRFVEVVVNGPKSWSLAAAMHPDIADAYDAAMDKAAAQIIGWLAQHSTTRVGPRGRQVQVPVEQLEAVTVRHYTSRAGDPHRHLHLQVNARVFAAGSWRGIHTVGVRDSLAAINGIGHAAMITDSNFRAALAAAGYTVDPASGEVLELAPFVGRFSERAAQIGRNIDRFEAEWRRANPGQEPGPVVRQSWDRRAWKDARPDKVVPDDGAALVAHWVEQLHALGYRDPVPTLPMVVGAPRVGALDRDGAVDLVLTRLGARRSAWNAADVRGEVERWTAGTGLVAHAPVRIELAEDLTARALKSCVQLLHQPSVPEHIRSLTSSHVLDVEAEIVARLAARTQSLQTVPHPLEPSPALVDGLDQAQREAVAILASEARLILVEGAAGAGKTTTLAATQEVLATRGGRIMVLTPTRKAAQVAAREVGAAGSVAWLVHQHGFRWDEDGRWTRVDATPADGALLTPGDLVLVDEAGMLDQDTAKALLVVADEMGARVAFVGDRHQLPAVGRGGVLDLAARWVTPEAHVDLEVVHRFADPEYAAISLALRAGSDTYPVPDHQPADTLGEPPTEEFRELREVFAALVDRGQVRLYASEAERIQALAEAAAGAVLTHRATREAAQTGTLVVADTREQVSALNGAVRDRLVAAGYLGDTRAVVTGAGERVGVGDVVATRLNDADLGVTNRAVWTVTGIGADGSLLLRGRRPTDLHTVPAAYAREHVELAYGTTVYGAQGETARIGHLLLGEHTTAASAYVGMTRGRDDNVVHLVADNLHDAHRQWVEVFSRDRADLGPTIATQRAAEEVDRYGTQKHPRVLDEVLAALWKAWSKQADLTERHEQLLTDREELHEVIPITDHYGPRLDLLRAADNAARGRWEQARRAVDALDEALKSDHTSLQTQVWKEWQADRRQAFGAALVARDGTGLLGQRRRQVHQAREELAAFAAKWQPVVADLPTDPAALTKLLTGGVSWMQTDHLADAINTYITSQVAAAHPDADQIRAAKQAAHRHLTTVTQAHNDLDQAYYNQLKPYRFSVSLHDPHSHLARVDEELANVDNKLATTEARIATLHLEPALRSLTPGALNAERDAWQTGRTHQEETARREAQQLWLRQQEPRHIEPWSPTPRAPDRGYGIGR